MENLSNIVIPEDVVNPKEYRKMLALQNNPKLRNTIYISSEGDEINIAMLPHRLKKFIEHLSPAEQEEILAMKSEYNKLRAKISTAHSLAYGRAGRYGGQKKDEVVKYQLSPFEEDIIELLGRMFTISEVVRIMGEDNGIIVNENDVKDVLKRHISEIESKREEFRNKVTDVRLYNKRPRLEELAWMYSKMKMRYVSLNSVDAYNCMLRTLEQIRKEAEGDIVTLNGAVDVNIEVTIQEHIQAEILKTINLKEIILGRVAARMNYDPAKLIAGLHNSYYAKFVDIGGDYDENAEMKYPSASAYDFAEIERNADTATMDMTPEEMPEEKQSTAVNVKALFLAKIRKQKKEMENRQAVWQTMARESTTVDDQTGLNDEAKRGRGRAKDKTLSSKTVNGQKRNETIEYYSGERKKK